MLVDEMSLIPESKGPQSGFHITRPATIVIHPHCRAFAAGNMPHWQRVGQARREDRKGVFARAVEYFADAL